MRNRKQKCMMACAAILAAITVMSTLPGSQAVQKKGNETVTEVEMDYAAQEHVMPVTLLDMTNADVQLQQTAQMATPQANMYGRGSRRTGGRTGRNPRRHVPQRADK